jgi:hypothetical protein
MPGIKSFDISERSLIGIKVIFFSAGNSIPPIYEGLPKISLCDIMSYAQKKSFLLPS